MPSTRDTELKNCSSFPNNIIVSKRVIGEVITTMKHARIFIASRQKMHPTGVKLYAELIKNLGELE